MCERNMFTGCTWTLAHIHMYIRYSIKGYDN